MEIVIIIFYLFLILCSVTFAFYLISSLPKGSWITSHHFLQHLGCNQSWKYFVCHQEVHWSPIWGPWNQERCVSINFCHKWCLRKMSCSCCCCCCFFNDLNSCQIRIYYLYILGKTCHLRLSKLPMVMHGLKLMVRCIHQVKLEHLFSWRWKKQLRIIWELLSRMLSSLYQLTSMILKDRSVFLVNFVWRTVAVVISILQFFLFLDVVGCQIFSHNKWSFFQVIIIIILQSLQCFCSVRRGYIAAPM